MSHRDVVREALARVHAALDRHRIWHCITYGTLLGAVRDGDIIEWDHDFDLFARPSDAPAIAAAFDDLAAEGFRLEREQKSAALLAMNTDDVAWFDPMRLVISHRGRTVGDVFLPSLFDDGVCRMYDFGTEIYWTPHSSFPHFFLQELSVAAIGGREYPAVGHPERFLEAIYGADWRTPYRSVVDGGEGKDGVTTHGDRYEPNLHDQIAWAVERGWDRSVYRGLPAWPRRVGGAGPIGPTARTVGTSRSLWWHDLDELVAFH